MTHIALLWWLINSKSILITESVSCDLKVTISKPCNGFLTIFHSLDGVCVFSLMDLNMEEEF